MSPPAWAWVSVGDSTDSLSAAVSVVAGSTMRDHVRKRRRELGLAAEAVCEQVHDPGVIAEVDWGEATVSLAGVATVFGLF